MNFNSLQQPLTEALGWTLIHSLWQGLIIAALLALAIRFVKNKSPKLTYQLCCLSLLGLVAWMTSTFINHFHWPLEVGAPFAELNASATDNGIAFFTSTLSFQQNIDIFFQSFIQSYADELVMLWLLGVGVFGLKWIGTLYFTYTLKRQNISPAIAEWQQMAKHFSKKLGIKKAVTIVQSTKVDIPMVIGYLKPVILIPASMATGFTSEQMESIIVHELAHVKSNDFLIGLMLSALEVVLFYHPMYWWVSGIISEEREKVCDDIAVAQCGNPLLYARTLFSIAERKQQRSLALSLQGKKNQLFDRIKRVCISPQGKVNSNNNKAGMALGLLFVLAFMALAQVPTQAKEAIFEPVKEAIIEQLKPEMEANSENEDIITEEIIAEKNINESVKTDTIPPSKKTNTNNVILITKLDQDGNIYITKQDADKQAYAYYIKKGAGKIYIDKTELEPGNHRLNLLPETQITFIGTTLIFDRDDIDLDNLDKVFNGDPKATEQYYNEVKNQIEDDSSQRKTLSANRSRSDEMKKLEHQYKHEGEEAFEENKEAELEEASAHHEEMMEAQNARHEEAMERHEEEMERHQEAMERKREALEQQREALEQQREEMQAQREQLQEKIEQQREEMEQQREELMERAEEQREAHEQRMERHREKIEADIELREQENDRRQEHNDQFHELLSENLYNDGLIKKKNKYKFHLTFDQLKVNNKKQSAELHKKYKEMYEKHYDKVMKENSNITIQRN